MSKAIITVDLGYGDSGKGTVVDALVRKFNAGLVVRFNGGSQCGHNVVTDEGMHHEFSQFGSGTFAGARTLLSKHVLVNPLDMMLEAQVLESKLGRSPLEYMFVDERALVTTPYHVALNRIRELSRPQRNGSCGRGIRETVVYAEKFPQSAIRVEDLHSESILRAKLNIMRWRLINQAANLEIKDLTHFKILSQDAANLTTKLMEAALKFQTCSPSVVRHLINSERIVIFEGAQGILLDQHHGFRPHITKSSCTNINALNILDEISYEGERFTLGIARTYMTKHGAGPFPTEDASLTAQLPDAHNFYNDWQQNFRVGYLDIVALKYAVECTDGINGLAVTHADISENHSTWRAAINYQRPDLSTYELKKLDGSREKQEALTHEMKQIKCNSAYVGGRKVPSFMAAALDAPLTLISKGMMPKHKQFVEKI